MNGLIIFKNTLLPSVLWVEVYLIYFISFLLSLFYSDKCESIMSYSNDWPFWFAIFWFVTLFCVERHCEFNYYSTGVIKIMRDYQWLRAKIGLSWSLYAFWIIYADTADGVCGRCVQVSKQFNTFNKLCFICILCHLWHFSSFLWLKSQRSNKARNFREITDLNYL